MMNDDRENVCYGLTRLAFVNSAKYEIAIFPIDRPLSIFGENNVGKSTAVNALQFLLINDQRKMNFGKHSLENSRKFYFPDPCSYILIEIWLEHGHYIVGAAGLGKLKQNQYQLFYYKGSFNQDHYVNDEDICYNLKDMSKNLMKNGIQVHQTSADELKQILMGNSVTYNDEITIIPFKNATSNNYRCFIEIFQNLIHMKKVRSADMKHLLINVFDSRLANGDIDFGAEYQKAYKEVIHDEEQLKLLHNIVIKSKEFPWACPGVYQLTLFLDLR